MQHKIKALSAYYLIDLRFDTNEKDKTLTHFNFKKTNGHKKKYSCGGYGGKCSMCRPEIKGKVKSKLTI